MSRVLFSTIRVVKGLAGTGGDLRSDRVLGRETTHPFHGGHRRHDQFLFGAINKRSHLTLRIKGLGFQFRRVRSVFERTDNFAESRLVVRSTKDRTLGTGFSHGTHRTMSTPSLRDAPSREGVKQDTIAVVGQVAQFNLTTKTWVF